ncbi:50S ribosomal protein L23 [Candidatus Woesearchaeota archaeon]|nr:50S ribosomal protein L23 [Candidatus Woesearchaeota archaeon]
MKKKDQKKSIKESKEEKQDPYQIIKYPLSTEKSIRLMESENKLVFVVARHAKKPEVKKAIETLFNCKVKKVNTFIINGSEKKAYVKFSAETPAIDIATNLGLM